MHTQLHAHRLQYGDSFSNRQDHSKERKKKGGGEGGTEATIVAMCLALPTYAFPSSRKTKLTKLHSLAYKSTLLHPPSRGRKKVLAFPVTLFALPSSQSPTATWQQWKVDSDMATVESSLIKETAMVPSSYHDPTLPAWKGACSR